MLNKNRRDFLKSSSLLLLGSTFHSSGFAGTEMKAITVKAELMKVLEQWLSDESLSPEMYLENRGVMGMDKVALNACTVNDFKCGNVFVVEGLVISKTEAAVLSQMASMLFL